MMRAVLVTERLTLRRPTEADVGAYAAYCGGERSRFVGGPFAEDAARAKFRGILDHWQAHGFGRYVIQHAGRPVGHVGPLAADDGGPPEMTWTLWTDAAEGRGFAREAARAVVDHLFVDLGWPALTILVHVGNARSHRLADALGARPVGVVDGRLPDPMRRYLLANPSAEAA
jgi:[ribosomal protein S5]-alanine N-acetyltransferase